MKFGAEQQLDDSRMTKYENFRNSRWRMGAILKNRFYGYNAAADCPISVKICVEKQFFISQNFGIGQISAFHRTYFFLMQLLLRRTAPFVSSPIFLFYIYQQSIMQ